VVLTPDGDEGWRCEQWGTQLPPFAPVSDPVESTADPMG
jgi:hypothetical protein